MLCIGGEFCLQFPAYGHKFRLFFARGHFTMWSHVYTLVGRICVFWSYLDLVFSIWPLVMLSAVEASLGIADSLSTKL